MWKHVAGQMEFPGGSGQKREDWVEHWHHITSLVRKQFRTTKDPEVRAPDPDVMAQEAAVNDDACTGPRKDYITKAAEQKAERDAKRTQALEDWEAANRALADAC